MKESKLIEMQKQIQALIRVVDYMRQELEHIKTMSVGTYQTIKEMPDYEEAIEKLKEKATREHGEGTSFDADGKISE
jgi:prefoldin subunit 5